MKQILLIDDDQQDALAVETILSRASFQSSIQITHLSSLTQARQFLVSHVPDLIILDLEFTNENTTSIHLLQDYVLASPVIILSHLSHYQNTLIQQVDIKAFIRKSDMESYLAPAVARILFPLAPSEPVEVIFPSSGPNKINEAVTLQTIRFIEKAGKRDYTVHLTSNETLTVSSVSFSALCDSIRRQGIFQLQAVSRNEIVNTSCLAKIYRTEKGRIELTLINLPERIFHVGWKYTTYFTEHYLKH